MTRKLIIDIYSEIDEFDIGEELVTEPCDIRCSETGEVFVGTFILKSIKKVKVEEL